MLIVLFVMCLCSIGEFGGEAVKVVLENTEIIEIDAQYFNPEKCEMRIDEDEETSETSYAAAVTVIKSFPPGTTVHLEMMKLSMGRYYIPTGMIWKMDLCKAVEEPVAFAPYFERLGWTKDNCPPPPGFYSQEGYQPPVENLPDPCIESKYVMHVTISTEKSILLKFDVYASMEND